ncbi:secretion protein HlyD [Tateyamaria omphalii]|uniref:efflux RND transporter periplasmic adaptor subunit n=1 Tax=Tateyamaria omphalii TaxID=299262 RepID=UPI001677CB96|nr:efflux RND transporter periplasmic adaptor subunit [Tateyamaria omphalii]GGX58065.1 secretion protein HlyD [Tateyamaria omphalii]
MTYERYDTVRVSKPSKNTSDVSIVRISVLNAIALYRSTKVGVTTAALKALLVALAFYLAACHAVETGEATPERPRTVALATVAPAVGHTSHAFVGTIQSSERVRLAFAQAGVVEATNVEIGDNVDYGMELARLEPQPFERRLERARAIADRAGAALKNMQVLHSTQKSLFERGVVPPVTFQSTVAQLEIAQADVRAADAELELSERMLREARIMSPINGTVARRLAEPGEFMQPGQTVFEIDGDGAFEAVVLVPGAIASKLVQGTRAILKTEDTQLDGFVLRVGERQGRGGLVTVEVQIEPSSQETSPGAPVEVRFVFSPHDVRMADFPLSAFLPGREPGQGVVFVFEDETSRIGRLNVAVIPAGGDKLRSSNLQPGKRVVTAGVRFLNDGDLVAPLPVTAD